MCTQFYFLASCKTCSCTRDFTVPFHVYVTFHGYFPYVTNHTKRADITNARVAKNKTTVIILWRTLRAERPL